MTNNINVRNMKSPNGNTVANQFIIETDNATFFQSYSTIIAKKENGILTLDSNNYNYSKTTTKYRNIFTRLTTKETEQGIKDGTILLDNLN